MARLPPRLQEMPHWLHSGACIGWGEALWPLYDLIAKAFKAATKAEGVPLEWGGDWPRFRDGPHFQLPWKQYPKGA